MWIGVTGRGLDYLFLHLFKNLFLWWLRLKGRMREDASLLPAPLLWSSICCCFSLAQDHLFVWQGPKYVLSLGLKGKLFCRLFSGGAALGGERMMWSLPSAQWPAVRFVSISSCLTFSTPSVSALLALTSPCPVVRSHLSAFCLQFCFSMFTTVRGQIDESTT